MAYRKHVGQIHVGKAFDILEVEINASPDLMVFKRFREDFSQILLGTTPKKLFDINSIKPEHKKILYYSKRYSHFNPKRSTEKRSLHQK